MKEYPLCCAANVFAKLIQEMDVDNYTGHDVVIFLKWLSRFEVDVVKAVTGDAENAKHFMTLAQCLEVALNCQMFMAEHSESVWAVREFVSAANALSLACSEVRQKLRYQPRWLTSMIAYGAREFGA